MKPSENKKVLLLSLSGIGNFMMQSPVFTAIKKAHPNWHLTVWVAPRNTKILAQNNPHIDEVIEMPIKTSLTHHFFQIRRLNNQKYDIAIILSPGQLLKSAAYLFLAGIPERIGHTYPLYNNPQSSLLLTNPVNEDPKLHDIEQNLNLLKTINIPTNSDSTYYFNIPGFASQKADEIYKSLNIPTSKTIIGIHAGSAQNFKWKRWPLKNFAEVGQQLIQNHNAHLLIFGGPDEAIHKEQLSLAIRTSSTSIISADLLTSAALMKKCHLLLTNDSGLMHLATAVNTPVLALFGPTNGNQTGPRGQNTHILRAPNTKPIYNTETNPDLGNQPHKTIKAISSDLVLDKISRIL